MASKDPRPTKAERRAAARAQAQALREQQEREARRAAITRRSLIGVGVLGVAGVGGALVYQSRQEKGGGNGSIVEAKADRNGVPSPVRADGSWIYGRGPTIDETNGSAAVLELYFDYACHHCADFDVLHADELVQLLNEGRITLVLRPCKILGQDWTDLAMNAQGVVLDQEPDKALDFHNGIAELYSEASRTQDASRLTVDGLVGVARSAGVSDSVAAGFAAAVSANTYAPWTELGTQTHRDGGFRGTPTVILAGETVDLASIGTSNGLTRLLSDKGL